MLIGGGDPHSDFVELISLDPDKVPVPGCLKDLSSFPMTIKDGAGGALLPDGHPIVCGGKQNIEISEQCWKYSPLNDTWHRVDDMKLGARAGFGWASSDEFGLLMAGGYDDLNRYGTIEAVGPHSKHMSIWPQMPYKGTFAKKFTNNFTKLQFNFPAYWLCMAAADNAHIFIGGGRSETSEATNEAYLYNVKYSMWMPAQMLTARRSLSCGGITSVEGDGEVIVAGGHDGSGFLNNTELYSLTEGTWRTGKGPNELLL